jgi:hypothetical protein
MLFLFLATITLACGLLYRVAGWGALTAIPWLALTAGLAHIGAFANFERLPPLLLLYVFGAIVIATIAGSRTTAPVALLIGFQAFRIPVEVFLHQGFLAGVVPVQMTWEGRNFDVLTGLAALPVAWLAAKGRLPRPALQLWNALGFALLVNIMTVAILSFPTPFRQFWNEPANVFVTRLPYVWLPTFLVPLAWFGHVAVWANARRNQTRP